MKGPKTLLAEAIAGALEEYFVVDQIQSQLLSDAAVTLNRTALKHRYLAVSATTRASLEGFVEKVAFEWHWGKSDKEGGSDLIKDTTLTLEGLDFTISLSRKNMEGASTDNETTPSQQQQPPQPSTTKGSIMQYVQNQVERIVDTLTLRIKNCKLTVILPDDDGQSKLEFGFSSIEINSMGRQQVGLPLLQELILQGLYCNAIHQGEVKYPILEEITYVAQTERTFGSRFSSWNQGVDVMGQSNDHGVVLYAGEIQMQITSRLVGILLEAPASASVPASVPGSSLATNSFEVEVDSEGVGMAPSAEYRTDSEDSLKDDDTTKEPEEEEEERLPSYIQLPLAGVSIILPNQTKLAMSELVLKYQMDGSIFSMEGKQGITVNDNSPFLQLGETSIWMADMTTSEFRIYDPTILMTATDEHAIEQDDDEFVAYICANTTELAMVFAGVMGAMGILRDTASPSPEKGHTSTTTATKTKDDQTKSSWTIHVPGVLGCLLETGGSNIELTVCNLQSKLANMSVTTKITKFHYPGMLHLAEPIEVAFFHYDGTTATVSAILHEVVVVLKEKKDTETTSEVSDEVSSSQDEPSSLSTTSTTATSGYPLPFGVHLSVNKFLSFQADAKSVHTTMEGLDFRMEPAASKGNPIDNRTRVTISVDELDHDMVRLQEAHFKSIFVLSDWDPVSSFHFGAKAIYVAAGYSLGDWKSLLPEKKVNQIEKKPLRLPFANVDKLKVVAMVKGVIGVNDTVINADPFVGTETTTTDDIVRFYSAKVTSQIPGMIGNVQILGTNVEDQVVSNYGGALLGNLVGGAGVGGLISVAAFDGVRNTIKAGKVARGVEETDDWRFSDIARGLQHAATRATQEGAAWRGKDEDEEGDVIDWAVGATSDATKYADKNKGRLAGAGTLGLSSVVPDSCSRCAKI